MSLPDELCPECHGVPELLFVKPASLKKRCLECGHEWREEVPRAEVRKGGYVL